MNVDKSEILLLGVGTIWDIPKEFRNTMKILGVTISTDQKKTHDMNYNPIIDQMKSSLKVWNHRHMSLAG